MILSEIGYWFMAALYAVAILNCFHILNERQSPSATFAWIVLNLALPVLGVPLFFLLGKNRIRGYMKKRTRAETAFSPHVEAFASKYRLPSGGYAIPEEIEPLCNTFGRIFGKFGPEFTPHPNLVQLLVDGRETFEAIFRSIASAKNYIFVQYYILRSDRLGLELKRLLITRAKAGVRVYLLYDDMGSFWLSQEYINDLVEAGVIVARFLPVKNLKRGLQINFRNHRKLVVVDGVTAFTGGLNIGEEYAERRFRNRTKKYGVGVWRDTHIQLAGPAVGQLEEVFLEDWHFATGNALDFVADQIDEAESTPTFSTAMDPKKCFVQVVPSQPTDESLIGVLLFMQIIQSAKKRLWIATPYFVPDTTLMRELELAALRGVDIRIIVPKTSDNRIVQWVTLSYAEQLMKSGVKFCLYHRGFMHQKLAIIDDTMSVIGSTNFDNRALYLNFETTLLIHGKSFAGEVEEVLNRDLSNCKYYKPATKPVLRFWLILRENLARLLAPLL